MKKIPIISVFLLPIVASILGNSGAYAGKLHPMSRALTDTVPQKAGGKIYKVLFFLQNNVEVLDFAGPLEVFTDAGFDVKTVSLNPGAIISQDVLKIKTDYTIDNAPKADILCFFGGQIGYPTMNPRLVEWIKNGQKPEYYFSVCSGAFYLAKAGLLDGLTVTTFHTRINELQQLLPKAKVLPNVRFVDNGKIITTAGISAGIDGALHLVSKLLGPTAAQEVAATIEYDKWQPENGLIMPERRDIK